MSDAAVEVEQLSKEYRIGEAVERHDSLRHALAAAARRRLGFLHGGRAAAAPNLHQALRDVSFAIKRGEVLGVIGKNGAGKSTLLKVLSRITHPTSGRAIIRGRVGSLLEVGTGFHQELTGRENVFLNGAILGMDKGYIKRRFDEIVDFANVERFIDTPVKRYSSGMYLRLAFAVAAHLDTEVLIVDEVLAVGDAEFQRKCIDKMGAVTKDGRTVVFVSHNMAAIQGLCDRALLLENGSVRKLGEPSGVIDEYVHNIGALSGSSVDLEEHASRRPGSEVVLRELAMFVEGRPSDVARMGDTLTFKVRFCRAEPLVNMRFACSIENALGQRLAVFTPTYQAPELFSEARSEGVISCSVPALALTPGTYYLTLILSTAATDYLDCIDQAVQFHVEASDVFGTGNAPTARAGVFFQRSEWKLEEPVFEAREQVCA